eukprot:scaffold9411_cov129-Isochrysis_galbana.AAC.1
MSGLRILSIGERRTVGVTKFILGSARGLYFDPRQAQQSLTSLLNALLDLLGGATGLARFLFLPRRALANRAGTPGPNKTKRGPNELEQCWNTNLE